MTTGSRKYRLMVLGTVLLASMTVYGQKKFRMLHRVDSLLSMRYRRANIDTDYVIRPQTKWTLLGRLNMSGTELKMTGTNDGTRFTAELKADYKTTVTIGVSYLGLSLNLSLNPAKLLGHYSDYEVTFQSYGKRFGFDFVYQDAHNFKGWHQTEGEETVELPGDLLKLKTLNVNAYYIFNNRRFSYPAAFAHSYIQRRSAGSFMLGASGQGQRGRVNGEQQGDFSMTNIGIGAGYGYNYVPAAGWLLHISALPTFIVYSNTSFSYSDSNVPLHYHFPEVIITGRGAVVKQLGRNKFAGVSMVFNFTNIGDEESLAVHNIKWRTRAFFGFRL